VAYFQHYNITWFELTIACYISTPCNSQSMNLFLHLCGMHCTDDKLIIIKSVRNKLVVPMYAVPDKIGSKHHDYMLLKYMHGFMVMLSRKYFKMCSAHIFFSEVSLCRKFISTV